MQVLLLEENLRNHRDTVINMDFYSSTEEKL